MTGPIVTKELIAIVEPFADEVRWNTECGDQIMNDFAFALSALVNLYCSDNRQRRDTVLFELEGFLRNSCRELDAALQS